VFAARPLIIALRGLAVSGLPFLTILGVSAGGGNPQCFTEQLYRQLVSQLGSQSDYFTAAMGYLNGDNGLPWTNQLNGSTLARFISNQGFVGFVFSNAIQLTAPSSAPTPAGSGTW